ncbi:MAG: DUF4437 domain-containing protein [Gammaproteobacteria bacterium]|jgi:quercetin dioxygenase-like cupin family protein|nr:DUF4437 domain-containing protein [Gammaproteobacteria bacterium]
MAAVFGPQAGLNMWQRAYTPKLSSGLVAWQDPAGLLPAAVAGSALKVLSRDSDAGALTGLWRFPAGWRSSTGLLCRAPVQLFVIEGALTIGCHMLESRHFAWYPAGSNMGAMLAEQDTLVLAMLDGPLTTGSAAPGAVPASVNLNVAARYPTPVAGPVPGIVVTVLRTDPATGGMTLYMEIPAGWSEPRAEHHDCVEESFKLAGEIALHENGREHSLRAGDYFFRPPRIKHGPMRSVGGTASIIRFSAKPENHYGPLQSAR